MINAPQKYPLKKILLYLIGFESVFWLFTFVMFFTLRNVNSTKADQQLDFLTPNNLFLVLLLIPFYAFFLMKLKKKNQFFTTIPSALHKVISFSKPLKSILIELILFRTALVCIIIALSQPVFGKKKVSSSIMKSELIFCIDISNSMNALDISPSISRLEIAKRALVELMNQLHGERVGIVVFAGNAFVQLPITTDYGSAKNFLKEIETSMISNQGTSIGEALKTAQSLFSPIQSKKRILLITDGENHSEDPSTSLFSLKENSIELFVLGIGTKNGGPVLRNPDRPELGYISENDKPIISKVNVSLLISMAKTVNGSATLCTSAFPDLTQLLK